MKNVIYSFLITSIAGFSTLIGLIPCYMNREKKDVIIPASLSFSAGVMLTISILSLIPKSLELFIWKFKLIPAVIILAIFIVTGIVISMTIDQKIEKSFHNNKLYKLGIISIIALILHNIPEGITTFISTNLDTKLGLFLAISIALHNIPEGISIAVPIYYSTNKINKALFYTLISGFSELLGAIIAWLFLTKYLTDFTLGITLSLTAGIMLHISIYELMPNSLAYCQKKATIIAFISGIMIMLLCNLIS